MQSLRRLTISSRGSATMRVCGGFGRVLVVPIQTIANDSSQWISYPPRLADPPSILVAT